MSSDLHTQSSQMYYITSRLPVRCDGLQQYPPKISIKKFQDFLLIVSALYNIFFYLAN
jgi:hypothetical protein